MPAKWWTLVAVCVAVLMLLIDVTIVNVALPVIATDLGASFNALQWVIDAYALTLASLLLTAGSIADRVGRRAVFVAGLVAFSLTSLACGLATSPTWLDLARGAQGIGGAAMFATALALVAQQYTGRDRAVAFGVFGAVTGAAVAIGPLVGGVLTQTLGWEWVFFVNVPIGVLAVALALTRVPESRGAGAGRIDWAGTVTFSVALFLLIFGLIRGNEEGWGSGLILGCFAGAAVLLLAFGIVETRVASPMLDLGLFRKPAFLGASVAAVMLSAGVFGLFLYLTLYVQSILGYSALQAGLIFLPITAVSFVVAPPAGRLTEKVPPRIFLGVGLALAAVGLLLMRNVSPTSGWTALLAGFLVTGAGIGMANPPLASTAVGVVPRERSGMASGINSTFRQVGIAIGTAGLGAVFESTVRDRVVALAAGQPGLAPRAGRFAEAVYGGGLPQVLQQVPAPARQGLERVARTAFVAGLDRLLLIGAVICAVGAVLSALLVRQRDFVREEPAAERDERLEPSPDGAVGARAAGVRSVG
jgi:EmrB/QacA subfamily drug resistance transporter